MWQLKAMYGGGVTTKLEENRDTSFGFEIRKKSHSTLYSKMFSLYHKISQ